LKTVERLARIPQVVGFKDGHGNMELNAELIHTIGSRLTWMNGMPFAEVTMPSYYGLGYKSYSSAISNYIPHISRLFFQLLQDQEREQLNQLFLNAILPLNRIRSLRKGYAVSLIKAGMKVMGLPAGVGVRPPLVELEKEHYMELEHLLKRIHDLYPSGA
jgi:5-dehydro-4-deoxyglucarate dehydratase